MPTINYISYCLACTYGSYLPSIKECKSHASMCLIYNYLQLPTIKYIAYLPSMYVSYLSSLHVRILPA